MPLQLPNLDDRDFNQLMAEALQQIKSDLDVDWSDLTPGDPGVVLLEAFAYLTEQLIYRLNRLPRKAYIAFLRLLGVALQPPTAASVTLTFRRLEESAIVSRIEAGTQVTMASTGDGAAPIFVTAQNVTLPAGPAGTEVTVPAYHCEWVRAESHGMGSGQPGLSFTVRRPPLVAPLGNELDLAVGVALGAEEEAGGDLVWSAPDGQRFRIWREVANFANLDLQQRVYTVDRASGLIQFAAAARLQRGLGENTLTPELIPLAAIPPLGREIRVWYARGGGPAGNVPAGVLTQIVATPSGQPVTGIEVTNQVRARGGMAAEALENALVRGPLELYSLGRAVTARDFEWVVLSSSRSLIARARAYTKAEQWRHARPGTVQMILVPAPTAYLPAPAAAHATPAAATGALEQDLQQGQDAAVLTEAQRQLDEKSPLGIHNELIWARYKKVTVRATAVIRGNEQSAAVKARLEEHLRALISPFPSATTAGWPFSQPLRVSDIYRRLFVREPAIHEVPSLEVEVEHAPDRDVRVVAADYFQPQTWYVGSGNQFFRSTNDGDGWELLREFGGKPAGAGDIAPAETIAVIRPSPDRIGLLAVATHKASRRDQPRSPLYISLNCGETWHTAYSDFDSQILDMAWLQRSAHYILLLATDKGLFEAEIPVQRLDEQGQSMAAGDIPAPSLVRVDRNHHDLPLYAVTVIQGRQGNLRVAVAAQARRGVYFSKSSDLSASEANTAAFEPLGLVGEDIRHLGVQQSKGRTFLWAASMAIADDGKGCYRWQFSDLQPHRSGGRWINDGWTGGSCYALAFLDTRVLAVSAWGGVLTLEVDPENPEAPVTWRTIERVELPHRRAELQAETQQRDLFLPLVTIAVADQERHTGQIEAAAGSSFPTLMVGGERGVYRSQDGGGHYAPMSRTLFTQLQDLITLPYHWLFISGNHEITVAAEGTRGSASDGREVVEGA